MNSGSHISSIRLEMHEGVLCVESSWLIESGMMSKSNYKLLSHRKQLTVVRRGCRNTPALVSYEMMPTRFKEAIKEEYGSPYRLMKRDGFSKHIRRDAEAAVFFSGYRLPDGRSLPEKIQWRYAANAEVLDAITTILNMRSSRRKALGGSLKKQWERLADDVSQLDRGKYPHDLPANHRRLKQKHKEYRQDGYAALVSKKFGNDNSRKVSENMENLILSLYCLPNKPYSSTTVEMYHEFLGGKLEIVDRITGEMFNRKEFFRADGSAITITDSTAWNYINDPKNRMIVDKYRMGELEYNNTHNPHHHRHAPRMSLSKVSMDDRDLPRKMLDGKRVKAYYAYDVLSGIVIGRSYSKDKDTKLFVDCMRNMFRFISQKGMGIPAEVEVEHHLVNNFRDDLMKAGAVFQFVRWANAGNAQEKHAENFNRQKKYGYEKRYQEGIGRFYSKLEANRTHEIKVFDAENNTYKSKKYEFAALVADDLKIIEKYNNGLHRNQKLYPDMTRMEVFMANVNPDLNPHDAALLNKYIGESRITSIRRSSYVTVNHGKYLIPGSEVLERLKPNNYKVTAYWMPVESGRVETIHLYQDDTFICEATTLETYNTARAERTDKDDAIYNEQFKYMSKHRSIVRKGQERISPVVLMENYPEEAEKELEVIIVEDKVQEVFIYEDVHDSEDTKQRALKDI